MTSTLDMTPTELKNDTATLTEVVWPREQTDVHLTRVSLEVSEEVSVSVENVEGIPTTMISLYAETAARHAMVKEVDPGVWVASVVGLDGAYSDADTEAGSLAGLPAVVADWVTLRLRSGADDIPVINGVDVNPRKSE